MLALNGREEIKVPVVENSDSLPNSHNVPADIDIGVLHFTFFQFGPGLDPWDAGVLTTAY
jgi:hypothetical protein